MSKRWIANVPPELRRQLVPIGEVKPLKRNHRRGDLDEIRASLRHHGQYKPIVVRRETSEVLVGNHTTHAARLEGWTHIAVLWRSEPDDDEARRLALVDNRTSDLAEWDVEGLAADLMDLSDRGGLGGTGYTADSLKDVLGQAERLAASEAARALGDLAEPAAPAPPKKAITRLGDVIELGAHTLVCGDARDPKIVAKALGAMDPHLTIADVPYGKGERTNRAEAGRGKHTAGGKQLNNAAKAVARDFDPVIGDDAPFDPEHLLKAHPRLVLFGANHYAHRLPPATGWIVWDKVAGLESSRPIGFNDNGDAELAWTNLSGPVRVIAHRWIGMVRETERQEAHVHPTQKPVALMAQIVNWRTTAGDVVYEPYAGAGPVLLACEELGRACSSIELDPGYCDVIVDRWETMTDQKASRPRRRRAAKPKEKAT